MIFFLVLLSHILGHKIPLWITGQKMRDIRAKGGLKQIFFEMSGVVFVFTLAFIVLTLDGLTTKETYLLNKNVTHGLYFNQNAKDLGFNNGDKIISVNDEPTVEYNEIIEEILNSVCQTRIGVRGGNPFRSSTG